MIEYEGDEPIRGLPARLPEGESILWQGEPDWRTLAIRLFRVRMVATYFAILFAWDGLVVAWQGGDMAASMSAMGQFAALAAFVIAFLVVFSYATAKTTVYTITSKRVVIRAGIALPKTINLPFSHLESAGLRLFPNGTGNVLLTLLPDDRLAYLVLWPHTDIWHLSTARPMLRALPDAQAVAQLLADAVAASGNAVATQPQAADGRADPRGKMPMHGAAAA